MRKAIKYSIGAVLVSAALYANAGIAVVDTDQGKFSIGGDVEFDFNYRDKDSKVGGEGFDQSGRVLMEFAGERYTESDHYFKLKAQSVFDTSGAMGVDDTWFAFGKKGGWDIKMGRFEGTDMFPVGQDTFLEYSGDTSNDLYQDDAFYTYQLKEARGRGAEGQAMYSQQFGNLYVEVGTMFGDRTALFDGAKYHGQDVTYNEDSFLLRPVVSYQAGNFNISASMETNLISDAITTDSGVDVSDRTGYGVTANYSLDDLSINLNYAHLDAVDETNSTLGVNVLYKGFGIGYIQGENEYEINEISTGTLEGDASISSWYASYHFANVLDVEDFSMYVGAYLSSIDDDDLTTGEFAEHDDKGYRLRFKYFF